MKIARGAESKRIGQNYVVGLLMRDRIRRVPETMLPSPPRAAFPLRFRGQLITAFHLTSRCASQPGLCGKPSFDPRRYNKPALVLPFTARIAPFDGIVQVTFCTGCCAASPARSRAVKTVTVVGGPLEHFVPKLWSLHGCPCKTRSPDIVRRSFVGRPSLNASPMVKIPSGTKPCPPGHRIKQTLRDEVEERWSGYNPPLDHPLQMGCG